MSKEFSKWEIASIKRTAQNVDKYVHKRNDLVAKKADLEAEINQLNIMINGWQEPVKQMTNGYTTEDLIIKTIDKTGKNPVTKYELKYPETVVPIEEEATTDLPAGEEAETPVVTEPENVAPVTTDANVVTPFQIPE